jgi:hypothetical protein
MRATKGNHRLRIWPRAGALVALLLLIATLFPAGALAATPDWTVGHGTDSFAVPQPTSGASSSSVSAGNRVGFFEWLRNDGTSNISQLFLTATTTPAAPVAGATWAIKDSSGTVLRSGSCPTATPLNCSFGALNPTQTVYVVVAFTTSASLGDGASQAVRFEFNTTGRPPGNNNSHGDFIPLFDSVGISKNGDAAGDFNIDAQTFTVADNQKVTGKNAQATSVTFSGVLVGAAVGDSPDLETPCDDDTLPADFPDWFSCSLLTSLTSVIEVGNSKTFQNTNDGPGIKVLITFNQSPSQLSGDTPFVYHVGAAGAELITETCVLGAGNLPTNDTPCLTVGNKNVTVWVFQNGPMRS